MTNLPDFLVIGAQKCGTTSLHHYLSQHPQLAPPLNKKELHFFDRAGPWASIEVEKGKEAYAANFPERAHLPGGALLYESTPSYLLHPEAPTRINRYLPHAKLIVLLRDPVSRAHSGYSHQWRKGRETLSFIQAIEAEEERLAGIIESGNFDRLEFRRWSYKTRGLYAEQLDRFLAVFPREQMLCLDSGAFFTRTGDRLRQIFAFLGVDPEVPIDSGRVRNRGAKKAEFPSEARAYLERFFAEPNEALFSLLGERFDWPGAA